MKTPEMPDWLTETLAQLSVKRELPKWPTLQVVGQNVSPELGREICLRTTDLSRVLPFGDTDDEWRNALCDAYGITLTADSQYIPLSVEDRLRQELGLLGLEYLGNDRVTATRFDLPSGWCNWDGTIGTAGTYLDSKWPSLERLNREWSLVAATWPTLAFTAQLSTYRYPEKPEELWPILTWVIEGGAVDLYREAGFRLLPVTMPTVDPDQIPHTTGHGVDIEILRQAIKERKEGVA